ncbi:mannose/glucose-specific lectin-like [Carex rostrata]
MSTRIIKKGPCGSARGSVKEMDLTGIIRIVKISIYHSEVIDSLTVNFEHNGIKKCTDRWGGDGGNLTEINLKTDEYIKSVEGYFNNDYNGHEVVMSLTLETNLDVYGPYGTERGQPFKLHGPRYSQIIGFHVHCEKYINAVGVYVQSIGGSIIEKGRFMYPNMQEKEMDPTGITRIVKIIIYHGTYIYSLIVDCEHNDTTRCTYRWGRNYTYNNEVNFETNEYITSVNGHIHGVRHLESICFVSSLVLKTNLRVYGPYGIDQPGSKPFEFSVPLGSQIIGFHGYRSDESLTTLNLVNALGVYVRQSNGTITKEGPFLGDGGIVKRMDPTCITRIVKIRIYHGYQINGLIVNFERNGTTQCTGLWGKNEGTLDEINFKTNEYIKSVKGNYGSTSMLNSLVLVTNLDVYGPYGMGEGQSFEHTSQNGQIISFFACVRMNHVIDLGVHIQVPTISKSVLCGGSGGSARDVDDVSAISRIWDVKIRYDDTIHALSVGYVLNEYSYKETPLWGGETGKLAKIDLRYEDIKSVRGYVGYFGDIFTVRSLQLITNYGRSYGPYGKEEGTPFELSAFDGRIIGFHGRSGEYLNGIGVYVKWIKAD